MNNFQNFLEGNPPTAAPAPAPIDFDQEYALALELGKKRFGSVCRHEQVKNSICENCLRTVISKTHRR